MTNVTYLLTNGFKYCPSDKKVYLDLSFLASSAQANGGSEEAINAAGNIGDDRMQKRARQYVSPRRFHARLIGSENPMLKGRYVE